MSQGLNSYRDHRFNVQCMIHINKDLVTGKYTLYIFILYIFFTPLSPCLGTFLQQIDNLIHSNLADIVVELLMTLYEGSGPEGDSRDLKRFTGY